MKRLGYFIFVGFILVGIVGIASAIPQLINYQGFLTDDAGVPVPDGAYDLTFRFWDAETDGSQLWSEDHDTVSVMNGLFNVILGTISPLELLFDIDYWLGVQVEGEPELPRIRLTSVGYSYRAGMADYAVYADSSDFSVHALRADSAMHSTWADTASWTLGGGSAAYADTAGYAFRADTAGYALSAPPTSDGDWVISGDNIYRLQGNVGIGTTNPTSKLHVGGGGQTPAQAGEVVYINPDATQVSLCVEENSGVEGGVMSHADGTVYMGSWSDHPVTIRTNNFDRLTVGTNGNVCIGTSISPCYYDILHLYGSQRCRFGLQHGNTHPDTLGKIWKIENFNSSLKFTAWTGDAMNFNEYVEIDNRGNVGLGTETGGPQHKLDVEGYVEAHGYYTGDIIFQKDDRRLWRMYEEEDGLYLESLKTGKVYRFMLQEVDRN